MENFKQMKWEVIQPKIKSRSLLLAREYRVSPHEVLQCYKMSPSTVNETLIFLKYAPPPNEKLKPTKMIAKHVFECFKKKREVDEICVRVCM